jgi:hypothetical protein
VTKCRLGVGGEEITQHQALPFCVKMPGQLCHSSDTLGHPGPALHNNRCHSLRVKSRTFDIVCTHSPIVHGRRKMGNGIKGRHEQAINRCHTCHRCQHGRIPAVVCKVFANGEPNAKTYTKMPGVLTVVRRVHRA